ncbi:hypothetical protein [Sporosarcina sp. E16_8]|uniref:hypothetical protein n=1 Tax=Sporosarcina sp. E16_8 TaxID=2789295 RepID=UPI001A924D1A|nr:hypothetical protein [Sporosarcina sp. E16_8]MBO0587689.1 hypothetical protein [Sporosarcina sp. E16_8]
MGSKYIDIALILFMSYFAVTRFADGQIGFGIFFMVLSLLNILTLVMKIKKDKAAKNEVR